LVIAFLRSKVGKKYYPEAKFEHFFDDNEEKHSSNAFSSLHLLMLAKQYVLNVAMELQVKQTGATSSITAPALAVATGKTFRTRDEAKVLDKAGWKIVEGLSNKHESDKEVLKEYRKNKKGAWQKDHEDEFNVTVSQHQKSIEDSSKGKNV
jgi:hypothetical protein